MTIICNRIFSGHFSYFFVLCYATMIYLNRHLPHEGIELNLVQIQIDSYRSTFSSISVVKQSLADTAYKALHLHVTANT